MIPLKEQEFNEISKLSISDSRLLLIKGEWISHTGILPIGCFIYFRKKANVKRHYESLACYKNRNDAHPEHNNNTILEYSGFCK